MYVMYTGANTRCTIVHFTNVHFNIVMLCNIIYCNVNTNADTLLVLIHCANSYFTCIQINPWSLCVGDSLLLCQNPVKVGTCFTSCNC